MVDNCTLGACTGLRLLGFSIQPRSLIPIAFECIWEHLNTFLSDSDKNDLGFSPIFVEHVLCKVVRWSNYYDTGVKKGGLSFQNMVKSVEDSNPKWITNENLNNHKVFPFPLIVKSQFSRLQTFHGWEKRKVADLREKHVLMLVRVAKQRIYFKLYPTSLLALHYRILIHSTYTKPLCGQLPSQLHAPRTSFRCFELDKILTLVSPLFSLSCQLRLETTRRTALPRRVGFFESTRRVYSCWLHLELTRRVPHQLLSCLELMTKIRFSSCRLLLELTKRIRSSSLLRRLLLEPRKVSPPRPVGFNFWASIW